MRYVLPVSKQWLRVIACLYRCKTCCLGCLRTYTDSIVLSDPGVNSSLAKQTQRGTEPSKANWRKCASLLLLANGGPSCADGCRNVLAGLAVDCICENKEA